MTIRPYCHDQSQTRIFRQIHTWYGEAASHEFGARASWPQTRWKEFVTDKHSKACKTDNNQQGVGGSFELRQGILDYLRVNAVACRDGLV